MENGILHLIYFKGDPSGGDIYYVRKAPGSAEFSKSIRVNNVRGSGWLSVACAVRGLMLAKAGGCT